jgi:ferritin
MLTPELETALNEQINKEFFSSYLYYAMSAHFEDANLPGFAGWMRAQADEEHQHAMRFFDHVVQRGGNVRLGEIAAPPEKFGAPLEVFEQALDHERFITRSIESIFPLADQATVALLQWFATEQVEEEQTVGLIVESLRMAGEDWPALLLLDRELGARQSGPQA